MAKLQFAPDQDRMNVSPSDVADAKRRALDSAGFNMANRTPAAAVVAPKAKRSAAIEEAIQDMQDEKSREKIKAMGYTKGGSVSGASKRADGIATKGKTRGKMC